jgi:hypothetical protein
VLKREGWESAGLFTVKAQLSWTSRLRPRIVNGTSSPLGRATIADRRVSSLAQELSQLRLS